MIDLQQLKTNWSKIIFCIEDALEYKESLQQKSFSCDSND